MQHPHANVQIAMVGDAQIGKTSLMVKYVEGLFSQDYIQSLGIENLSMIFLVASLSLVSLSLLPSLTHSLPIYPCISYLW